MEKPNQNREIRVVGKSSQESKEKTQEEYRKMLFDHLNSFSENDKKQLKKEERQKTEEELELIKLADKESSLLMEEIGLESFSVSPDNVHFILPDFYENKEESYGRTYYQKQALAINEDVLKNNPVSLASTAFHEIMHLKSHITVEKEDLPNGETKGIRYRFGVVASSPMNIPKEKVSHFHFFGLSEAIVSLAQQNFVKNILESDSFKEEKEWMSSEEAKDIKKEYLDKYKIEDEEGVELLLSNKSLKTEPFFGLESRMIVPKFSYPEHKKVLKYICSEIQKQFSDKYSSQDEVFKEFLRANFTGQLLTIARLVEKTFGEGSFRSLGEMTAEKETAVLKLETFKKLRSKMLKEKAKVEPKQ